jgi:site-specific DNA-methyltransferase (adenine-specific)
MIIPARWFGGGKGLDQFRSDMINDNHIRVLHDFLNASDCFGNGVEIKGGICYFLWDRDNASKCKVYTHNGKNVIEQEERFMKEENSDVFIRYAEGVSIYHKVKLLNESTIDSYVSSQKPFGLRTYVHGEKKPFKGSVKMYERGGIGFINPSEITRNHSWVQKPKVYISAAYNAGDTYPHQIIGKPIPGDINSCCTETYVVVGPFDSPETVANVISYIQTKLFRFLVMLKKTSQHAAASVYSFVPVQDFSHPWTDEELYKKYGITDDEIAFIDSMIKPMDLNGGDDDAD